MTSIWLAATIGICYGISAVGLNTGWVFGFQI